MGYLTQNAHDEWCTANAFECAFYKNVEIEEFHSIIPKSLKYAEENNRLTECLLLYADNKHEHEILSHHD